MAVLSTSFFMGCESDDLDPKSPNRVSFEVEPFLSISGDGTGGGEIGVYTSNVTGSDRTFPIQVESSLDASNYSVSQNVTIPAGTNKGTITVEINAPSLPNFGETLTLSFGDTGAFTGDPLTIDLFKVCPFEITGNFTDYSNWNGAIIPVEVVPVSLHVYKIKDLYAPGVGLTFLVNPDFSITVQAQSAGSHPAYGPITATGDGGSFVSTCEGTMTFYIEYTVDAGSFGVVVETLVAPGAE